MKHTQRRAAVAFPVFEAEAVASYGDVVKDFFDLVALHHFQGLADGVDHQPGFRIGLGLGRAAQTHPQQAQV